MDFIEQDRREAQSTRARPTHRDIKRNTLELKRGFRNLDTGLEPYHMKHHHVHANITLVRHHA